MHSEEYFSFLFYSTCFTCFCSMQLAYNRSVFPRMLLQLMQHGGWLRAVSTLFSLLCAESEEAVNTGPAHIKIRFPWNVGLESFSSYSMLQGRARIQTLIKITQLFFFFLCSTTTSYCRLKRIMLGSNEFISICCKKIILDSFVSFKPR